MNWEYNTRSLMAEERNDELKLRLYHLVCAGLVASCLLAGSTAYASVLEDLMDPVDGQLDMTGFLKSRYGFMPVPILITEPAVGFGGGLALAYFHKDRDPNAPKGLSPTVSFAAAAYTSNNTWLTIGGHQGSYLKDRIRYLGVLGYVSVNLTFYGSEDYLPPGEYRFNMKGFLT
jgi:hypothetical protein